VNFNVPDYLAIADSVASGHLDPAEGAPSNPGNPQEGNPQSRKEGFGGFRGKSSYRLPGREALRPCLRCHAECPEGELFCRKNCFVLWKAERTVRRREAEHAHNGMPSGARSNERTP
jgi:hypothetical protein